MTPTLEQIRAASERIEPWIHRTPVMTSRLVDDAVGARVFLKCENLQRTGAFKARGAHNAVFSLTDEEAARGVVGTSSGNHAQALALAARNRGIDATIVIHDDAPSVKAAAVADYGAAMIPVAPREDERLRAQRLFVTETGAAVIPPFDDDRIIAGAGTAALELIEEVGPLDMIIGPVGGGGLMSGTSIAAHGLHAGTRVLAAEPLGADDAKRSLEAGHIIGSVDPDTIADGLLTSLSERTYGILSQHLEGIETAADIETIEAMRFIWTRTKLIIEPSAAVAVAVALKTALHADRVGIILSGGNVDLDRLPWNQRS